jgi:amino acid transporter
MGQPSETLQEQVEEHEETRRQKFGTFGGVFRPTVMTIIGVILFIREGWIVGNAGLLGAWLIIGLAFAIVTLTALSMSCITTNIRIGAGGAYSIISQSLGLEVGGSVAIPLYLAQALAGTMYIFGFREGLIWFSEQFWGAQIASPLVLDLGTFAFIFAVTMVSTKLAFRVQYVILVIMIAAIGSVIATFFVEGTFQHSPELWGEFPGSPENGFDGTSFWVVFAVFFPAATGVMAGANLSGDLQDPRRSIPRGTLAAIGVSFVIYMLLAYWLAAVATPKQLVSNYNVMIDHAMFPSVVAAGLLGATLSSALSSLVGAPRILQALGDQNVFPYGGWLAERSPAGEPRHALMLTAGIILASVLLRDLNTIAPMITMFFLITYMMINMVVLVEQSMDMVSFRPQFPVPRWVPLLGTLGCMFAMFIISPTFGIVSVTIVIAMYVYLSRRMLDAPHGDMRSGLFHSMAEWAAKSTSSLPASNERAWKPNLLVPFEDPRELRGEFDLIKTLIHPRGSVALLEVTDDASEASGRGTPAEIDASFRQQGVYSRWTAVEADTYHEGVSIAMDTLGGSFFRPNVLFTQMPRSEEQEEDVREIIVKAKKRSMGVALFCDEPVAGLGTRSKVNVWITDQSPNWEVSFDLGNVDLALLFAYKLQQGWDATVRVVTAVEAQDHAEHAEEFLENLLQLARLTDFEVTVQVAPFAEAVETAPQADLDILGLADDPDFDFMHRVVAARQAASLFVSDSGDENILA